MVESISLLNKQDQIIWSFSSNGKFLVQSLYAVINHIGVMPVYVHAVWKLQIPPRVQILLWLLVNNMLLSIDNLAKHREVMD
jgi:hypothetical protein